MSAHRFRWKEGAAHAPQHEVYGQILADVHGGSAAVYARHLRQAADIRAEMRRLSNDRAAAWDVLMGVRQ